MIDFIVNVTSRTGKAKAVWEEVEAELIRTGTEYRAHLTEYVGHATELAGELTAPEGIHRIVVVGGDGTANEVINGLHLERSLFGYIPTGSGNDLGRGLEITGTPTEQLHRILSDPQPFVSDLGRVETEEGVSRLFAISGGIGLDADVCKQALTSKLKKFLNKIHLGQLTYVLLTVKTLFTMPLSDGKIVSDTGVEESFSDIIFAAAMIHRCEGGGVPMAPKADPRDGLISTCCVHNIPRFLCFLDLPRLIAAKHENIRGFELINCRRMEIHLAKPMVVHADGEYCGTVRNLTFTCLPEALSILK